MLCAAFTARVLGLPLVPTLTGAVLAGLPSLLAVLLDLHWAAPRSPSASSRSGAPGLPRGRTLAG